jgi:hypothetical protein
LTAVTNVLRNFNPRRSSAGARGGCRERQKRCCSRPGARVLLSLRACCCLATSCRPWPSQGKLLPRLYLDMRCVPYRAREHDVYKYHLAHSTQPNFPANCAPPGMHRLYTVQLARTLLSACLRRLPLTAHGPWAVDLLDVQHSLHRLQPRVSNRGARPHLSEGPVAMGPRKETPAWEA